MSAGLLLSLLPRTSFISHSTDEIVDAVGPVWPDQSVEQVLDNELQVVSEIRIWAAAGLNRGEAPVVATLLRGPDHEIVRQTRVGIKASNLLKPYILKFAPYQPSAPEILTLQLWVSDKRDNSAIFGTTEPIDQVPGPTINRNPTVQGQLAYETIWRGDGWRAALAGSWLDSLRLAGGILAALSAIAVRPSSAQVIRLSIRAVKRVTIRCLAQARYTIRSNTVTPTRQQESNISLDSRRILYFPWLIPIFAIAHYIVTNLILIRPYEAILITLFSILGITLVNLLLRLLFSSAAAASVMTGIAAIAFFSYGHIYPSDELSDDRYLVGLGIPIILGLAILLDRHQQLAHTIGRTMNIASVVLIILPIYQFGVILFSGGTTQGADFETSDTLVGLNDSIQKARERIPTEEYPDIYFLILDEYPRSGSPATFDNGDFVRQLERRGFYVDPHARSNYTRSAWSVSSMLNMTLTDTHIPYGNDQEKLVQVYNAFIDHNLGQVVTSLGYKYVHVSSGWYITETSPRADLVVSFGPQGRIVSGSATNDPCVVERIFSLSNRFTDRFLETTAANRFISSDPRRQIHDCTYHWSHPQHTLDWLSFMKESADINRPKFVFAHLIKPHGPYMFDQHGSIAPVPQGWDDDHDPTVDGAFYGQIIWLNNRILEVVDSILKRYENPPIIVIMGDHGYERSDTSKIANDILAAYLLPNNGSEVIYPSITPVNVFRAIFNRYFGLNIELLRDRVRHL